MTRRAVALVLVLVAGTAACDDAVSHIYAGREYNQTRTCLDDVSSIDVVSGPEPETPCAPVCIVGVGDDTVPTLVYVSTMCPPLPEVPYDTTGTNPLCAQALVLYAANTTCLDDGGVTNPFDAESFVDAGVADAARDATVQDASDATAQDASDATAQDASDATAPHASDAQASGDL